MPRFRLIASLALATTLAGCTALLPSQTASPAASSVVATPLPTFVQSASPVVSASPPGSAAPTSTPTLEPSVSVEPSISAPPIASPSMTNPWLQLRGDRGLGHVLRLQDVTAVNGRYALVAGLGDNWFEEADTVLTSDNGIDWTQQSLPGIDTWMWLYTFVHGAPEFVVVAGDNNNATSVLDVSSDGTQWSTQAWPFDSVDVTFGEAGSSLVALADGRTWSSSNGIDWTQSADGPDDSILVDTQAGAAAISDANGSSTKPSFLTADGVNWVGFGGLADMTDTDKVIASAHTSTSTVLISARDWEFSNQRRAWTFDGHVWRRSQNAPLGARNVTSTADGFVATGICYPPGTRDPQDAEDETTIGVTWISADGDSWRLLTSDTDQWRGKEMMQVLETDSGLAGLGSDSSLSAAESASGTVWLWNGTQPISRATTVDDPRTVCGSL